MLIITREKNRIDYKYRSERRTFEVLKAIKKHQKYPIKEMLDLGTADGLMLSKIKNQHKDTNCIGIEYSPELIKTNKDNRIKIIQGDVQKIPFSNNTFDVVITTAVIEHIENPSKLISEAHRVLNINGLLVITTPNPFYEKIATSCGLLSDEDHNITFNLKTLNKYLIKKNFSVSTSKKFMMSPVGFPFELQIESLLKKIKLDFIFLNQIIVGVKKYDI